jgi:hypothetical protein
MKEFDYKKYLAEGRLLKEDDSLDSKLNNLEGVYDSEPQISTAVFNEEGFYLTPLEIDDIKDTAQDEYSEYQNQEKMIGPEASSIIKKFKKEKYLAEGKLLKENAPGYSTRKFGESLPTLESVKAAYEAKNDIKEEEEDYDTGGYVEAMNPELFDHIDEVIRIFKEWKDDSMADPGMEGYAKDDLVDYIQMKIRNA